jgi:hypothetical protein
MFMSLDIPSLGTYLCEFSLYIYVCAQCQDSYYLHLPQSPFHQTLYNKSRHLLCGWAKLSHVRVRETFVVACIVFIYMKIFVCFIKQACLLAAHVHELCGICHSAHSIINSLSHFSFLENICLSYKTSSLACNPNFQISKFGGGWQ